MAKTQNLKVIAKARDMLPATCKNAVFQFTFGSKRGLSSTKYFLICEQCRENTIEKSGYMLYHFGS